MKGVMTRSEVVWAAIDLAVHVLSVSDHADEAVSARPHDAADGQQCALGTLQQLWVSDRATVIEWFDNAIDSELGSGDDVQACNYAYIVRGLPELSTHVSARLNGLLEKMHA